MAAFDFDLPLILAIILVVVLIVSASLCIWSRKQAAVNAAWDALPPQIRMLKAKTNEFSVPYDELHFGKLLGKGSQGEVFLANWRGANVAVKKVDTRKVQPDIIEEFCQEADMMRRLRHPCLTLFLGVSLEHPNLCIVTECVNRGSLFDILHDEHSPLTWAKCLSIAYDVAQGMAYLHGYQPPILHRDLKSLNILVDENWRGKVADFGMTKFQEDGTMTQCGSPLWMAPEMIQNKKYNEKMDVYSFGICLWELYTRRIPYRTLGLNPSHLVVRVVREDLRPAIPKYCPKSYADLMTACWAPKQERRPTFTDIITVLEKMNKDPVLLAHKPGSDRQQTVAKVEQTKIDESAKFAEANWKIDNPKVEVTITEPLDRHKIRLFNNPNYKSPAAIAAAAAGGSSGSVATPTPPLQLTIAGSTGVDARRPSAVGGASATGLTITAPNGSTTGSGAPSSPRNSVTAAANGSSNTGTGSAVTSSSNRTRVYLGAFRGTEAVIRRCYLDRRVLQNMRDTANHQVFSLMSELAHCRHPNTVLFMGAYVDSDHVGIVKEYMSRGSLDAIIHDINGIVLEWDAALGMLIDVCQGMTYLHGQQPRPMIHADLRTNRLLVDKNWRVKIDDYGFLNLENKILNKAVPVSIYSAPELLIDDTAPVREASNVYSFAIIMWEMFTRKKPPTTANELRAGGVAAPPASGRASLSAAPPIAATGVFDKAAQSAVINAGRPPLPATLSPDLRELIEQCWRAAPERRPTFTDILHRLQELKASGPPKIRVVLGENAHRYRKKQTVFAYRSKDAVTILKDWGKSVGKPGTYIILSGDDDVYLCDPLVFQETYEPVGASGDGGGGLMSSDSHEYRKIGSVIARYMELPFSIKSANGTEHGSSGDYIIENDKGDQWIIDGKKFLKLYERMADYDAKTPAPGAAGGALGPTGLPAVGGARASINASAGGAAAGRSKVKPAPGSGGGGDIALTGIYPPTPSMPQQTPSRTTANSQVKLDVKTPNDNRRASSNAPATARR